ncbi:MAG: winged helix-turn-helix transcriptional regulator [Spirochaetes bacterium]|nr:winged helix-turn-helix transcriptional regulator [Spirochaetota bacterium]
MEHIKKLDDSEYKVIDILNEDNRLTQRHIAKKAGISLGLTNIIIRRLVKKGFVKIKNMDKKRILYHLTPKALIEKSYRTYHYFERTVKDIVKIRDKIQSEIMKKYSSDLNSLVILGDNEISEIAIWAAQELKLKYRIMENGDKQINVEGVLVINCERVFINKKNYINVFKML